MKNLLNFTFSFLVGLICGSIIVVLIFGTAYIVLLPEIANELINTTFLVLLILVFLKAVIVGSDFSFVNWFKYGKLYTKWYNSRPTFKKYLRDQELMQIAFDKFIEKEKN